ncbi:MAG: sodium:proton antiporter NhaD [Gammaproteobacteria bacterium]|nr:sodium:proton antiporter NhaD [Gammaproteobacteria bacterium]
MRLFASILLLLATPAVWASEASNMDLTTTWFGIVAVIIFTLAYGLVIAEEQIHLRKSKPMMVAAGLIWILVALAFASHGDIHTAEKAVRHNILEFAELLMFLLAAMTYINTMEERGVFDALRGWLISKGFSLYTIFWITGVLAFMISPIADNLTTALLMAAVVMAVAGDNKKFVAVACINIVVAANAGGAFSPFGDITTLMVWQKGIIEFSGFFVLFLPALVNWLVPALIMSFVVPKEQPPAAADDARVKKGGYVIIGLFLLTIAMAVSFHSFLHLPPMLGMMTGLGVLNLYGYYLKLSDHRETRGLGDTAGSFDIAARPQKKPFDIFQQLQRAEWDTLMFFYGVILCVGGLGTLGYLSNVSNLMYAGLGATTANILVGVLSAVIDNIPVMFAVLSMNPEMSQGQWLLVTLTAGVGGSLLSVGSAAGVALMGQARGTYTFFSHLKWSWAIALGYAASIWVHFLVNGAVM